MPCRYSLISLCSLLCRSIVALSPRSLSTVNRHYSRPSPTDFYPALFGSQDGTHRVSVYDDLLRCHGFGMLRCGQIENAFVASM